MTRAWRVAQSQTWPHELLRLAYQTRRAAQFTFVLPLPGSSAGWLSRTFTTRPSAYKHKQSPSTSSRPSSLPWTSSLPSSPSSILTLSSSPSPSPSPSSSSSFISFHDTTSTSLPARIRPTMTPTHHRRYHSSAAIHSQPAPGFAFAFDIDGVLLRTTTPIAGATEALNLLHAHNIPFILLTNSGGKHESVRVADLTKRLGVHFTEDNFVQSHTPFKQLVHEDHLESLKGKTVLVTGGDPAHCRKVAEQYGFQNVITPGDILVAYPSIWPHNAIFSDYYNKHVRTLPRPIDHENPSRSLKIDAIFVFNDPRDWALDSQIILDLLLSKQGILGTYSEKNGNSSLPNNGWQQDGQPKLYFSNPDVFFATSYHLPRLAQGGFQASLQGIWDITTNGASLARTTIGKPSPETYKYAERVLNKHRAQMLGGSGSQNSLRKLGHLHRVYMVGDNPESDIRGANEFESTHGTDWTSILVKTGVHRDGMTPAYKPRVVVEDVMAAVKWALDHEGWEHKAME